MADKFMDQKELSGMTGVAESTLEKWRSGACKQGPPYVKLGRLVRYHRRDVDNWLKAQTRGSAAA